MRLKRRKLLAGGGAGGGGSAGGPAHATQAHGQQRARGSAAPVTIVSARLLSCQWPQELSEADGSAAGGAPAAAVAVECVYADADPGVGSAPPESVPALMAVRGMPLEQCALGVPLRLPYLLRLRPAGLPGALREVVSSTPLVGALASPEQQLGGGIVLRRCFVDAAERSAAWHERRRRLLAPVEGAPQQQPADGSAGSSALEASPYGGGADGAPGTGLDGGALTSSGDGTALTPGSGGSGAGGACGLPSDPGSCGAAVFRWFFDAERATCRRFVWGGCGGNANSFGDAAACAAACGGAAPAGADDAAEAPAGGGGTAPTTPEEGSPPAASPALFSDNEAPLEYFVAEAPPMPEGIVDATAGLGPGAPSSFGVADAHADEGLGSPVPGVFSFGRAVGPGAQGPGGTEVFF
ncbi:MAG: hypothetical protein J3K34DRAFT_475346 [Monoraphidium minutum]|nr:MAG: hypothetical protein J3K34DRAFT_475346 [Monoraphidium minutum]